MKKSAGFMKKQDRRSFLTQSGLSTLGALSGLSAGPTERVSADKTYHLSRQIPVDASYDIVVAGGGPAGAAAAICAGRLGSKVLLIESTGCLGGMGTSGLVTAFDPMANGEQTMVGGLMREIVETLYKRNFLQPGINPEVWRKQLHKWTPFNAEGYKLVLDELVVEAGVEVRFFTRVIDADADAKRGIVNGLILNNVEGYRYVKAKAFIDCTGDAILSNFCGVKCREAGIDTPRIMPATLASLFSGIDWSKFPKSKEYEYLQQALKDGHFTQNDRHLPGMSKISQSVGYLNGGHMFNLNALRTQDLSSGIMLGRRLAQEYYSFYRKYVPGCENLEHVTTASLIGVRESRRIVGEYELNINDYIARRKFPDQIGIFCKYVDVHAYDTTDKEWTRFKAESGVQSRNDHGTGRYKIGEYFGIPYGILVPKGWQNLWVAGRCTSADIQVNGSIRVQPACSMMGQAAGTAAAQAIKTGQNAGNLDTKRLVETLRSEGANLPQASLSSKMTRA